MSPDWPAIGTVDLSEELTVRRVGFGGAATALAHGLTVWSQDDDFEVLGELAPELRVKRG